MRSNLKLISEAAIFATLSSFSPQSLAGDSHWDGRVNQNQVATSTTAVPVQLQPPSTQVLLEKFSASGVQIYLCQPQEKAPQKFEWKLKAPEAILYASAVNKKTEIGKHYAGPTWEHKDGSKIQGKVKNKADSPGATAIPWLLLDVTSHGGRGVFTKVNYIQRLNTIGGKAPASGCDATQKGKEVRINYTADYYFFGEAPAKKPQ